MDYYWLSLYIIDGFLFTGVTLTVMYFAFFSVVSLFSKTRIAPKARHQNRFIVIIPAYKADKNIVHTVASILSQNYPQRMFDVVVISDHQSEITNMKLAQYTITLLTPNFEKSTKVKSLQYAVLNLPAFKIYDVAVILNADNIVEAEFLEQLNDAYEAAGTKAITCHLMPRNRDTAPARLSTIFEEINNSIFRRGHITIGFSSSLSSAGVAYEFEWFKKNIMKVRTSSEDRELEGMLVHQQCFIDYFDYIHIYNERKREATEFNRQRGKWIIDQYRALFKNIHYLPSAIINQQYDWMDKIIQWMLIPRSIMFVIVLVMDITLPFIYLTLAIKWWIVTVIWGLALAIATPNELVDKNWDKDFISLPMATASNIYRKVTGLFRRK